jgi:hypothetical protein
VVDVDKRRGFFQFLFGDTEGYLCIAALDRIDGSFRERFFEYPEDLDEALEFINNAHTSREVYYCPHLLNAKQRKKENVAEAVAAWADLDECPPDALRVTPTIVVQSSHGRFQALWKFKEPVPAADAEDISKRIAYAHAEEGADTSGWDLTQLLRVPLTLNHKYRQISAPQKVMVTSARPGNKYRIKDFNVYNKIDTKELEEVPFPEQLPDKSAEEILEEYKLRLNPKARQLYETTPERDWSRPLWELELSLFESGLSREEVFVVAEDAACNKYKRDDRDVSFLWKDVVRAWNHVQRRNAPYPTDPEQRVHEEIPLLTEEERKWVENNPSIVEHYIEWAKNLGDAAWQYHQAGVFIILSTILSGNVQLPTSFGTLRLNMWFMILADTTLTRKTTAMDLAMDLLMDVDPDCVLATDGSIEGLLTSLSMRPGRPSIFLRDEFTGLMEMMSKKDYYAGMMESLTKLYDGKYQKRVLRKEIIEVRDPLLVLFAGGIKDRMQTLLKYEHISSGFVPRFVFVTAESDITKLKPLGPPTARTAEGRQVITERLRKLRAHYTPEDSMKGDDNRIKFPVVSNAVLTDDAWVRYNRYEHQMMEAALKAPMRELMTPLMARLSLSGLKAATLLAAADMQEELVVTEEHLIRAFYYVEQWRRYSLEMLRSIGKSTREQALDRIYKAIMANPGLLRSNVMQNYHLSAKEADAIFSTLEQRGLVRRERAGNSERLYCLEV